MVLNVDKFGTNKVGLWVLGTISNDFITYSGLFNLDKEYVINEKGTYNVSLVSCRLNKKGILRITLALK